VDQEAKAGEAPAQLPGPLGHPTLWSGWR
jgi:hypothetical protein